MISANGGLPAHRYTPQVTPRWPRGSEPASVGLKVGASFWLALIVFVHTFSGGKLSVGLFAGKYMLA